MGDKRYDRALSFDEAEFVGRSRIRPSSLDDLERRRLDGFYALERERRILAAIEGLGRGEIAEVYGQDLAPIFNEIRGEAPDENESRPWLYDRETRSARDWAMRVVDSVCDNPRLSEDEKALEVATRLLHDIRLPERTDQEVAQAEGLVEVCDRLTELGVSISEPKPDFGFGRNL